MRDEASPAPQPGGLYRDGGYLARNPGWHEADAPFKAEWIAELLAANAVDPTRVVDIGCGAGGVLAALAARFPAARFDGYEISPQAHALALAKRRDNLAVHLREWPPDAAADLALAVDVVEHVEDYLGFLRRLRTIAALKLFHIPLDLSVQGLLRPAALAHARGAVGHLHYFTKETALATLADCGYRVLDWRYTHGATTLPGRAARTRALALARRALVRLDADLGVRLLGGASLLVLAR